MFSSGKNGSSKQILAGLTGFKQKIKQILVEASYEKLQKNCNSMAKRLAYFVKLPLSHMDCEDISQTKGLLEQVMGMMMAIVKSTQFEKYGHVFPFLASMVKVHGHQKQYINQTVLQERIKKNEQSDQFKLILTGQLSLNQIKFLKSNFSQQHFRQLRNAEIILQSSQCLCCSQVFIKDFDIQNANPMVPFFTQISTKSQINKRSLIKYLTALCNQGGGVLIIGAQRKEKKLKAIGIRFKDHKEIEEHENQINQSILAIRPRCTYLMERVLVHTNFLEPEDSQKSAEQYMRLCIRVLILPHQIRKFTYAEIVTKGKSDAYQIYDMNQDLKLVKIPNAQESNQTLYELIKRRYKQNNFRNSHHNIYCLRPYHQYSKIFTTHAELGLFQATPNYYEKQQEQNFDVTDDLEFKYLNTSLLVLSSKQNDRYKDDLCGQLIKKKKQFKVQKPYQKQFKLIARSIWMISHQMSTTDLSKQLISLQQKQSIPPKSIKLIPVHRNLQIQTDKFTEYIQKMLNKKLQQRFKQNYKYHVENGVVNIKNKEKKVVNLEFGNFGQAIYAYLVFQEMQIFPYFAKSFPTVK